MTDPQPTKSSLPIPTGFGWLLLESLEQNSWLKKIAQIAALGAAADGMDESRAQDAFYKLLSNARRGKEPRTATLENFKTSLYRGGKHMLAKSPGYAKEHIDHIAEQLNAALGPYTVLAIQFVPLCPTTAQRHLLDYSARVDQLGASFTAAVGADDLDAAKHVLLDSNLLDEAYWSFPDPGMEDPRRNRKAINLAVNWEELTRASVTLLLNTTLAWLSCLDLAVVPRDADPVYHFPHFLPLATRFTPEACAAICENRPTPAAKWSACLDLPIPNLIRMLKRIATETELINQKRAEAPKYKYIDKWTQEDLSTALKEIGRHDLLSITQFDNLLRKLVRKAKEDQQKDCELAFDVRALHLAANLFSLLTPRDGQVPTNESRRKRPTSITFCEDIPAVYESWWQRNLKDMTGETSESPRPEWFTQLLGETVRADRPD